jgi:hypothetical protein
MNETARECCMLGLLSGSGIHPLHHPSKCLGTTDIIAEGDEYLDYLMTEVKSRLTWKRVRPLVPAYT